MEAEKTFADTSNGENYKIIPLIDSKITVLIKILINLFLAVFGMLFWVIGFFCKMAVGAFLVGCDAFDNFFKWVND